MEYFEKISNRHAPIRKFTVRSNGAPWMNKDVKLETKPKTFTWPLDQRVTKKNTALYEIESLSYLSTTNKGCST